jgi:hypothetical protein
MATYKHQICLRLRSEFASLSELSSADFLTCPVAIRMVVGARQRGTCLSQGKKARLKGVANETQ